MQKLFDSELKVMELIWANEPISAKELSILADKEFGWNKNTTYTVIKKLRQRDISSVPIPVLYVFHLSPKKMFVKAKHRP